MNKKSTAGNKKIYDNSRFRTNLLVYSPQQERRPVISQI
jgi:hypothetical protein